MGEPCWFHQTTTVAVGEEDSPKRHCPDVAMHARLGNYSLIVTLYKIEQDSKRVLCNIVDISCGADGNSK